MDEFTRPKKLKGFTTKIKTGFGNTYITINELDGKPVEVFAIVGKSGKSVTAKAEAIGRLVTLNLQNNVPVEKIANQLKGISGENPVPDGKDIALSIPDAIGKILEEEYVKNHIVSDMPH